MILQQLSDLTKAAGWMQSKEFTDATVHWLLRIDGDGRPLRDAAGNLACWFQLTTDPPPGSRKKPKPGRSFAGCPKINRRNQNDIKPSFLVGRADRLVFGGENDSVAGKTRVETSNFVRKASLRTEDQAIRAVANFYELCDSDVALHEQLRTTLKQQLKAQMASERDENDKEASAREQVLQQEVAFSLEEDQYAPVGLRPAAKQLWLQMLQEHSPPEGETEGQTHHCLCCGKPCSPLRIHEAKIKGLPGPGRTGVSLIAYNKGAFQSHGLEDSLNAPMCQECVDAYTTALDRLVRPSQADIAGPSYGGAQEVAGIAFCYWCRNPLEADPMQLLFDSPVAEVEELLRSVRSGIQVATAKASEDDFYVLPISAPSKGRAVVHDWITTSLARGRANLAAWFEATAIVDWYTAEIARPVRLTDPPRDAEPVERARILDRHIPSALSRWNREKRKWEVPARLIAAIVRSALQGAPLPMEILLATLTRLRSDVFRRNAGSLPGFTTARLGLMRAVLNQHPELLWKGEPIMPGLDRTRDDPAYVCGRLLAVLSRAQAAAIRGDGDEQRISASVIARYYSAASSRPATGLYVPIKMRIPHLAKLDRDSPGLSIRFRKELEEIFGLLGSPSDLPDTLTPAEQCVFAIGFEHEITELWRPRPKNNGTERTTPAESNYSE